MSKVLVIGQIAIEPYWSWRYFSVGLAVCAERRWGYVNIGLGFIEIEIRWGLR